MQSLDMDDDLTLRLWEGDDSVKGDLLMEWGGRVKAAIRKAYARLSEEDLEDVIAEAVMRFWVYRERYDPSKARIGTLLYKMADNVAKERISGRLAWQKARIKERGVSDEFFADIASELAETVAPDDIGPGQSPLQKALADCFGQLQGLQQDILQAYFDAGSYPLDAATLGIELGDKHKNGVPIPGGTIRVSKSRAWDSLEGCMRKKRFDLPALGYTR